MEKLKFITDTMFGELKWLRGKSATKSLKFHGHISLGFKDGY